MISSFIQWLIICYYHLFLCSYCPSFSCRSPFTLAPVTIWHVPSFVEGFLFLGKQAFQASLYFPCSSPQISSFPKNPGFLSEKWYSEAIIWVQDVFIAAVFECCCSQVLSVIALGASACVYIHEGTYTYGHTKLHLLFLLRLSVCIENHEFMPITNSDPTPQGSLEFSPFPFW